GNSLESSVSQQKTRITTPLSNAIRPFKSSTLFSTTARILVTSFGRATTLLNNLTSIILPAQEWTIAATYLAHSVKFDAGRPGPGHVEGSARPDRRTSRPRPDPGRLISRRIAFAAPLESGALPSVIAPRSRSPAARGERSTE